MGNVFTPQCLLCSGLNSQCGCLDWDLMTGTMIALIVVFVAFEFSLHGDKMTRWNQPWAFSLVTHQGHSGHRIKKFRSGGGHHRITWPVRSKVIGHSAIRGQLPSLLIFPYFRLFWYQKISQCYWVRQPLSIIDYHSWLTAYSWLSDFSRARRNADCEEQYEKQHGRDKTQILFIISCIYVNIISCLFLLSQKYSGPRR